MGLAGRWRCFRESEQKTRGLKAILPTANITVERDYLEALMSAPLDLTYTDGISLDSFVEHDNKEIWKACEYLISRGKQPALKMVQALLKHRGLDDIQVKQNDADIPLLRDFRGVLHRLMAKRLVDSALVQSSNTTSENSHQALDAVKSAVRMAESIISERKPVAFTDLLAENKDYILKVQAGEIRAGVDTGYPTLQRLTSGFKPQELVILAARPKEGKSALAWDFCWTIAHQGPVLFFSLEMTARQLAIRSLSKTMRVEHHSFYKPGEVDKSFLSNIQRHIDVTTELPLFVEHSSTLTAAQVASCARRFKAEHGTLAMVAVDHTGKVTPRDSALPRPMQVEGIISDMKDLAVELECPVMLLHHLNRDLKARANPRPLLTDLKDSGAVEAYADIVMLLHNEEVERANGSTQKQLLVDVAANRSGEADKFYLRFDKSVMSFTEMIGIEPNGKQQSKGRGG